MSQSNTEASAENAESNSSPGLSAWKKALFALTITVFFFVVCEVLLALCGVRPVLYDEDPFVGFASHIPLFVEQPQDEGEPLMVTAKNKRTYFNHQKFSRQKAPGVFRIFCVGGSTTYGRPYEDLTSFSGWLRELLPVADPSQKWEVINAGGISYASYRVCGVIEELIEYEPDLFIIYSGHNEFLERRTYSDMFETPKTWTAAQQLVNRTRTFSALKKILKRPQTSQDSTILESEVNTILDHSFGPEDYTRDDTLRGQVIDHYRFNLGRMIDMASSVNAGAVLVVPASNLKNCSPFKSERRSGMDQAESQQVESLVTHARELQEAGKFEEALPALDEAREIDDRYADVEYLRGLILYELGDYEQAKASLIRAMDEDVCPLRQLTAMRTVLSEVAAEREVPLFDFSASIENRAPNGIPGEEIFLDHVHLTIAGYKRLALDLVDSMSQQGIVRIAEGWDEGAVERIAQKIMSQVDVQAQGKALKNLAKVLDWAGKKDESGKLVAKAQQILGDDPGVYFLQGTAADASNSLDEAIEFYRKTVRLQPDHKRAHNNLGVDLHLQGNYEEAAHHFGEAKRIDPEYVDAYNNLGNTLRKLKRTDEAVEHYEKALQLQPDYARAHNNLANTLRRLERYDEALVHYEQAVLMKPKFFEARRNFGLLLTHLGRPLDAVTQYEEALRFKPDFVEVRVYLSTLLSTYPDEKVRDGQRALELAEQLVEGGNNGAPFLGALAAAHAELGDFAKAVEVQEQALEVAPEPMKKVLGEHLELYRAGKPLRMEQ